MPNSEISIDEFYSLIRPLIGMPVSLPWKGYGSAIFLELGALAPLERPRQRFNRGEACISFEWDWRVEEGTKVLFGSSNWDYYIEEELKALQGLTVDDISITDPVRELALTFSNGQQLRSMVMRSGDPEWCVRMTDSRRITSEGGFVYLGDGSGSGSGLSEEERAVFDAADATALRWGSPSAEPKLGNCRDCKSYIRLAGNGHLLDFGVCIEPTSPFDGCAVRCIGGCPAFTSETR